MPADKRKHERLSMTENVNVCDSKSINGRNLSLGGICIQVANKMQVDDVIEVEFHLPSNSNKFSAQAKVKWQEKSANGYFTGLEFINVNVVS